MKTIRGAFVGLMLCAAASLFLMSGCGGSDPSGTAGTVVDTPPPPGTGSSAEYYANQKKGGSKKAVQRKIDELN